MTKHHEGRSGRAKRIYLGRFGHKLISLDRAFDPGAEPMPQSRRAGLLDLILRAISAEPENRRRDTRHDGLQPDVWVGWQSGSQMEAVAARLINLSRGGARAVMPLLPPRRRPVWIYKQIGATLASVRGDVVGHTPAPRGLFSVRFRFPSPCPTDLCQAVICAVGDKGSKPSDVKPPLARVPGVPGHDAVVAKFPRLRDAECGDDGVDRVPPRVSHHDASE